MTHEACHAASRFVSQRCGEHQGTGDHRGEGDEPKPITSLRGGGGRGSATRAPASEAFLASSSVSCAPSSVVGSSPTAFFDSIAMRAG